MEQSFSYELLNVKAKSQDKTTPRSVRFIVRHEEASEGAFNTLQIMDEEDPFFYFLAKITTQVFREIKEKNELTFEFSEFNKYLDSQLRRVDSAEHLSCQVDYVNAPKLLIIDTSDKWRDFTVLEIRIKQPTDSERIEHLSDKFKSRGDEIRSLQKSREELERDLQKYKEQTRALEVTVDEMQKEHSNEKQQREYEHQTKITNLKASHSSALDLQKEKHKSELDRNKSELSATRQQLGDVKALLSETENSKARVNAEIQDLKEKNKFFEETQVDLNRIIEELKAKITLQTSVESRNKITIEKWEKRNDESLEEKEESKKLQADRNARIILLEHELKQSKSEMENLTKNFELLREKENEFTSQKKDLEFKTRENEKLDADLAKTVSKLETATDQVKAYAVESARNTGKIEALTSDNEKLRDELKRSQELYENMMNSQQPGFPTTNSLNFAASQYQPSMPDFSLPIENVHQNVDPSIFDHVAVNDSFQPQTENEVKYSWMEDFEKAT